MGLAAPTTRLGLILLLLEARQTLGGAHLLCLNFTVRAQASPVQAWCEVQGSVDGKPFLQCDSDSSKDIPLGLLGEEVKDTKTWTYVTQTLEDVGRELRMLLLEIKLRKILSVSSSLEAKMCCQREAGQCTGASWEFSISGQTARIDTMTMKWTVMDPGARGIKEEWESNQDLAEHFSRISTRSCSDWLKEFLQHWEKMLEPTEPPAIVPGAARWKTITPMPWVLSVILTCLVTILDILN